MKFEAIQVKMPQIVGKTNAINVSLTLPVSAFIVLSVVAQGKCKSEKSITFTAVNVVQPLSVRILLKTETEEQSTICVDDR